MNRYSSLTILFCTLLLFFSTRLFAAEVSKTDSLIKQLAIAKEDTNKVNLLYDLSVILYYSEPAKALIHAQQALTLSEKLKWKKGMGLSHLALCWTYSILNNSELAFSNYFKSIKFFEEINYKPGIGRTYMSISNVYGFMGNFKKTLEFLDSAVKIFAEIGDDKSLGNAYISIGAAYGNKKDYADALIYFHKGLEIAERLQDSRTRGYCYLNIGEIYFHFGHYDKALDYAKKGMEFTMKLNDKNLLAAYHINIGQIYYKQAKYKEALSETNSGLSIAKDLKNKLREKDAYYTLSEIYSAMGNDKEALHNYKLYEVAKDSLSNEQTVKNIAELEAKYKIEKAQQKIDILKKENEIQTLKLESKNYLIGALILIVGFMIFTGVLFVRQIRLKQNQKSFLLEQKALRAQINPHFFSNALNSIQKLILKGEKINAHEYIVKFSSLMRTILNNSDKTFIHIEDELSAVRLYLEIEQLRVDNGFDYEIHVAPEVDIYETYMPSMFIQPYVENAIWHGLNSKETKGKVTIKVAQTENLIVFSIEDNGVGRVKTAETKRRSRYSDKPSGMKLVKDRIDAINAMRKTKLKVVITDLADSDNLPIGTKVEITMPIES